MTIADEPMPFVEAVKHLMNKEAVPSGMTSADWKMVDAAIRRQSLFSAQTTMESYLEDIQASVESIINPATGLRGTTDLVTTGLNPATARAKLREALRKLGYSPEPGKEGTLLDLSS